MISLPFLFVLVICFLPLGIHGFNSGIDVLAVGNGVVDIFLSFFLAKLAKCSKTFRSPSLYRLVVVALLDLLINILVMIG